MHTLGVAPPSLPQGRLTSASLAAAITEATDAELTARATVLGWRFRAEHGSPEAATGLANLLQGGRQ